MVKATKKSPRAKKKKPDAVTAFMALVAERGWRGTSLPDVAEAAGIPLDEFSRQYWTKTDLLIAFQRRIDEQVLADTGPPDEEESPRDRLFDILMRRFDALLPYKEALGRLGRDLPRDPLAALVWARGMKQAMTWILAAADTGGNGICRHFSTKGLIVVWLFAVRAWMSDDSPDMSKTMAALDKALARAESVAEIFQRSETTVAG
ncbi:TetR family transcriptional regulator [Hwanghaeella grinnelliae]|nr:TetR family transcriptional regulator [Hwanghaeella grinnelliae]